jgi:hypothetical protein
MELGYLQCRNVFVGIDRYVFFLVVCGEILLAAVYCRDYCIVYRGRYVILKGTICHFLIGRPFNFSFKSCLFLGNIFILAIGRI